MEQYNAIYPGKPWYDTNGKRIQAHGGSMLCSGGKFYWYGENKEKTFGYDGIWHWGVRLYSSVDLYNWQDEGIIPSHRMRKARCIRTARWTDLTFYTMLQQKNIFCG